MTGTDEAGGHSGGIWDNYLDVAWLATTTEEIFEPDWPIVDPHHHMWWEQPFTYGMSELLADVSSGHRVAATLYMESGVMYRASGPKHLRSVGEVEYANGFAAMSAGDLAERGLIEGIVGNVNLALGADKVRAALQKQIAVTDGRLKAIRVTASHDPFGYISWGEGNDPPPGLLFDEAFNQGVAVAAELGIVIELMVFYHQLADVATFASQHPSATFIVNHTGAPCHVGPYADLGPAKVHADWLAGIEQIAEVPNVILKLGGLTNPFFCDISFRGQATAPTSDQLVEALRPWFDPALKAFGAGRCMFESNFPVDKQVASYHVLWNAFKKIAALQGDVARDQLLAGTAIQVYGLQLDG